MSDLFDEFSSPRAGEIGEKSGIPGENQELAEISELSKKGYQYLRESNIEEAVACYSRILKAD
jgi:hypothetical protein